MTPTSLPLDLARRLLETADACLLVVPAEQPSGRPTFVGGAADRVTGLEPELLARLDIDTWLELVHPDDRESVRRHRIYPADGAAIEYRIAPTGELGDTERWVQERWRRLAAEAGDPDLGAWLVQLVDITPIRTREAGVEEEVRRSEARMRALVEQLPVVVYVDSHEERPRSLYVSPNAAEILGHEAARYLANDEMWVDTIHPDDVEGVLDGWSHAIRTGETFELEYRMVRPDGSVLWIRDTSIPVRDERGEILAWQGVMLDVTAEREAEAGREASEARYRALVEGIPAVLYEMGPDDERRTLYVSPQVEHVLGYSREEWLDQPDIWIELLHPDDREPVLAAHDLQSATGEPWQREYRLIASDGRTVWVRDQAILERDAAGSPLAWHGVLLDVSEHKQLENRLRFINDDLEYRVLQRTTELAEANEMMALEIGERRRMEQELRAAQERWRLLVEDIPACVYIWEMPPYSLNQFYVSPAIEEISGFTVEEWVEGILWKARIHPHDVERIVAATDQTAETGEPFEEEYRLLAKDGHVVEVFERATLLSRDAEGKPLLFQGILVDLTARKRAEAAAADLQARFRRIVEEGPLVTWLIEVDPSSDPRRFEVEYVAPQVERLLGYSPDEIQEDPTVFAGAIHPDDEHVLRETYLASLDSGEPWVVEHRMLRRNGSVVWVRSEGRTVEWEAPGRPLRVQGYLMDVTDRRESEARSVELATWATTLVEHIPAVPWTEVVDVETGRSRLTYLGPQCEAMTGYTPEELLAEHGHFSRLVHPDDRERVLRGAEQADRTGDDWVEVYRLIARDGIAHRILAVGRRVPGSPDRSQVWHGVTYDLTGLGVETLGAEATSSEAPSVDATRDARA